MTDPWTMTDADLLEYGRDLYAAIDQEEAMLNKISDLRKRKEISRGQETELDLATYARLKVLRNELPRVWAAANVRGLWAPGQNWPA